MSNPLTDDEFSGLLSAILPGLAAERGIALAVSGGPDSMALAALMARWRMAAGNPPRLHILSIDHRLRPESADEAAAVARWAAAQGRPDIVHRTLTWDDDKPETGIMEAARAARYALMASYCAQESLRYLFLAHHRDDQAETVLIRLSKGSGLDGLCGMRSVQSFNSSLTLVRPLLDVPKDRLLATCAARDIPYADDPSNRSADYTRPRLRSARAVLEAEGLTSKRLAVTAERLERARQALDAIAREAYEKASRNADSDKVMFDLEILRTYPEEIGLRVVLKAMRHVRGNTDYGPRLEKVETLFRTIREEPETFKGATLGGCLFSVKPGSGTLLIARENINDASFRTVPISQRRRQRPQVPQAPESQ